MHSFFEILFWSSLCLGGDRSGQYWWTREFSNETKDVFQWEIHPCRGFFLFLDFVLILHQI